MIRNVVLGRLRDAPDTSSGTADRARLDAALAGIAALDLPGMLANRVGQDAGLREGNWSFAITNDWLDALAYGGYDIDAEHNVHRAVIAEVCVELARVQFEIPASDRSTDR